MGFNEGDTMNIAFYCVAINGLLPILWVGFAKMFGGFKLKDNVQPREFLSKQSGLSARANAAQANSWEAFAPFAAAVIIAYVAGGHQDTLDKICMFYTGFRIVYGITYLANQHIFRSIVWSCALLCNLACYGLLIM